MSIYIGVMSGTSVDSVDTVAVTFPTDGPPKLIDNYGHPFPDALRNRVNRAIAIGKELSANTLGELNTALGQLYADAVLNLIKQAELDANQITAIGNHGQTVLHCPNSALPFTLQLGDPNIIAEITGITTVSDFRRRDMAAGGQGAPLVPGFHQVAFADDKENRTILNIGGIANITVLSGGAIFGFDTGPGNTLMDTLCQHYLNEACDCYGQRAAKGNVDMALFDKLQRHPYFSAPPPKSTGREMFNLAWLHTVLEEKIDSQNINDILATLNQFTAWSIIDAIQTYARETQRLLICGGGSHNLHLIRNIERGLNMPITLTDHYGIGADWVEATAFAWLAKQTIEGKTGNCPEVTGAKQKRILGLIAPGSR